MRYVFLFLLIVPISAIAQKKVYDKGPYKLESYVYDITPSDIAPDQISLPFKSISVIDARYDTSKLGFELHRSFDNVSHTDFKKIKLAFGVAKSIEDFYNKYYSHSLRDTAGKLVIVIKTLWIDNVPVPDLKTKTRHYLERNAVQNIYLKFEYYYQKNQFFYPVKRTDTVYQLTPEIIAASEIKFNTNDLSFFNYALKSQMEKYDYETILKRLDLKRGLIFENIDSFNRKRFLLPVLTAEKVQKGIFLNYGEFRNNAPSVLEFGYKKGRNNHWYNKKDTSQIREYFAVSDEDGLHTGAEKRINIAREGNTFEWFEAIDIFLARTIAGNLLKIADRLLMWSSFTGDGTKQNFIFIPRQVNMETGEVY